VTLITPCLLLSLLLTPISLNATYCLDLEAIVVARVVQNIDSFERELS